jgi:hypothetical protein
VQYGWFEAIRPMVTETAQNPLWLGGFALTSLRFWKSEYRKYTKGFTPPWVVWQIAVVYGRGRPDGYQKTKRRILSFNNRVFYYVRHCEGANMAVCTTCGSLVFRDGQECDECFYDRFTAYYMPRNFVRGDIAMIQRSIAEYEQRLRRLAFEAEHPDLFKVRDTTR